MTVETEVFISYAHADRDFVPGLRNHLAALRGVHVWDDDDLRAGEHWPDRIESVLGSADVVVFLLSGEFFGSSYCTKEREVAFRRRAQGEAIVVPFFVRRAPFVGTSFQNYEGRPKRDAGIVPVEDWDNKAEAYALLAEELFDLLSDERTKARKFWRVPKRYGNFIDGGRLVAAVESSFERSEGHPLVALIGPSGYGKTSVALEYAQQNASRYDHVFWLAAQRPAEIARDFAAMSAKLGLPATDQPVATAAVTDYLAQQGRWLIVFDNAPDFESLSRYVPQTPAGHILVTSRNVGWGTVGSEVTVRSLPHGEARRFLMDRIDTVDEAGVDQIATALGNVPLDLELAARTITQTGIDLATYAARLASVPVTQGTMGEGGGREKQYRTATTIVALESLKQRSVEAADLLIACSFLAAEDIPRQLLLDHGNTLPGSAPSALADEFSLSDAAAQLGDYGLVQVDDDGFSIHRRIQASVRDSLTPAERSRWATGAVELVMHAIPEPPDDPRHWDWMARLIPHLMAVIEHVDNADPQSVTAADARAAAARHLVSQGQLALAREYVSTALTDVAQVEPDGERYAKLLNQLAIVERELGHLNLAYQTGEQALDLLGRLLRERPSATPGLDEARSEAERGAEERPALPNDPSIAEALRNLGMIELKRGQSTKARDLLAAGLDMLEALHGDEDLHVADGLVDVFSLLVDEGDHATAYTYLERAVDIRQRTYGSDDHDVIISRKLMSILHWPANVDVEARELVALHERFYSAHHPRTADACSLLGTILEQRGEKDEARQMFERALSIDLENFGPRHFRPAVTLTNLMLLHAAAGRQADAETALGRIVEIIAQAPEGERQNTLRQTSLPQRLSDAARQAPTRSLILLAESAIERAFPRNQALLNDAREAVARALRLAGDYLLDARRPAEAVEPYRQALRLALLTESDPFDDARCYARLGYAAALDGDASEAENQFAQAMGALAEGGYRVPVWGLLRELSFLHHVLEHPAEVEPVLAALLPKAMEGGIVPIFRGEILAPIPEEWFAKESTTLLAPDGQANVIASSEPLDPSITNEMYAETQGELLRSDFPGYREVSYEAAPIFGGRPGFIRTFEWTPPDGVQVTQIQCYYADSGRGYTGTATTPSSGFPERELTLRSVLGGLNLAAAGSIGT
ncbi:MAG: FxSxx-COOH system tetratricopeptide repeat protein [Solirubrobacteraceae bacterium]